MIRRCHSSTVTDVGIDDKLETLGSPVLAWFFRWVLHQLSSKRRYGLLNLWNGVTEDICPCCVDQISAEASDLAPLRDCEASQSGKLRVGKLILA